MAELSSRSGHVLTSLTPDVTVQAIKDKPTSEMNWIDLMASDKMSPEICAQSCVEAHPLTAYVAVNETQCRCLPSLPETTYEMSANVRPFLHAHTFATPPPLLGLTTMLGFDRSAPRMT